MPAPGDQHNIIANPFEDPKPRISEFTAKEIATLQSRLEKQLGPEYLSARSGPSGQKVHYIAAEKCIALANEVFGFNGWSSSIQNIQVDFVDENPQTLKISLGLSVIVRVTLRDGTFHEDIGYGHIENCKGKAAAFEKAKKEGTTDALKRALRSFGNVLGNCIYDKDYLAKVTKMKFTPTKFDEENLHRHSDFAKKESDVKNDGDKAGPSVLPVAPNVSDSLDEDFGDFDMADFGVTEDGHPDEVVLPGANGPSEKAQAVSTSSSDQSRRSANSGPGPARQMQPPPQRPQAHNGSSGSSRQQPQTPNQAGSRQGPAAQQGRPNQPPQGRPPQGRPNQGPNQGNGPLPSGNVTGAHQAASYNGTSTPPTGNEAPPLLGFFSARSAEILPSEIPEDAKVLPLPAGAKPFDPRAESPSIRKTPGIDHRSSKPVSRTGQHVAPTKRDEDEPSRGSGVGFSNANGQVAPANQTKPAVGNPVNPSLTNARQIGVPGGLSPMGNRGHFKPLSVKRPAPGAVEGGNRAPLNELSTNGSTTTGAAVDTDAKRQKTA